MKNFNIKISTTMLRMFKVIQAICVLYYGIENQGEKDRKTAIENIFKIAHVFVDSAKENHSDWMKEILDLENGLIKSDILKEIDKLYKERIK
ncbi:MAG TPA: hypothetical protein VGB37_03490 [Candidatus Lokiarchaeia archaeon]